MAKTLRLRLAGQHNKGKFFAAHFEQPVALICYLSPDSLVVKKQQDGA